MLDAIITAVIRVLERFGRVSGARWPSPARLEQDSRRAGDAAAQALARGHVPRRRRNLPRVSWPDDWRT